MSKANKNIRHLRALKSWSQSQLAEALEIPRARIGAYEEERCEPPVDVLIKLSDLFHIAIDAMVRCDLSTVKQEELIRVGDNRILFPILVDDNREDMVEVLTVQASAGYLGGYADPEYIGSLKRMSLPFEVQGKCRAFPIRGDSMPPLIDGSYVIGKYIDRIEDLRNGRTYIVVSKDDGLVYKRLYLKGDQLELHSDNPMYKPYALHRKEVLELWEFVCSVSMEDKKKEELNNAVIMQMLESIRSDVDAIKRN
ncbi:MAG: XRE family transcriptional regulator [Saprospiraceae bacterium]